MSEMIEHIPTFLESWADAFAAACAARHQTEPPLEFTGYVLRGHVGNAVHAGVRIHGAESGRTRSVRIANWQPSFYERNAPEDIAARMGGSLSRAVEWVKP